MVKRLCKPVAVLLCVSLLLQGCAWMEEHPKTVTGAATGAAAGGLLGYLFGGRGHHHHHGRGMVVGALAGALIGGAIGAYLDHRDKTAQQTNQAYSYAPEQGLRVELAAVTAQPAVVAPGGRVNLQVTYAIMAPADQQSVAVTETRVITYGGTKVAELSSPVTRTPGTYTSQVPVDLQPNAAKGQYQLTITVTSADKVAQGTAMFTVN